MKSFQQTSGIPLSAMGKAIWVTGQSIAFLVTGLVLFGLFFIPDLTLKIVWFAVVPLLPASFLINAGMWRGLCPIASVNMMPKKDAGMALVGKWLTIASIVGLVLLGLLVPLRRVLLNVDGPALAIVLVAIVALALVMGFVAKAKGGFCNSICPVLPVEKLYGQSPLVSIRNPRCIPCNHCTSKGCLDIDPSLSVKHAVGSSVKRGAWLASPFGIFAAAFPGFIYGYFQLTDGALSDSLHVYQTVFMYAGLSLVLVGGLSFVFNVASKFMLPFLGAFSIGMYYWFAVPASFEAFGLAGASVVKFAMLALVVYWLMKALQSAGATPTNSGKQYRSVVAASLPK